jgi:hypothetical protein
MIGSNFENIINIGKFWCLACREKESSYIFIFIKNMKSVVILCSKISGILELAIWQLNLGLMNFKMRYML